MAAPYSSQVARSVPVENEAMPESFQITSFDLQNLVEELAAKLVRGYGISNIINQSFTIPANHTHEHRNTVIGENVEIRLGENAELVLK